MERWESVPALINVPTRFPEDASDLLRALGDGPVPDEQRAPTFCDGVQDRTVYCVFVDELDLTQSFYSATKGRERKKHDSLFDLRDQEESASSTGASHSDLA